MRRSVLAVVNGVPWDMHRPLSEDCELNFLHFKDEDPRLSNEVGFVLVLVVCQATCTALRRFRKGPFVCGSKSQSCARAMDGAVRNVFSANSMLPPERQHSVLPPAERWLLRSFLHIAQTKSESTESSFADLLAVLLVYSGLRA